MKEHINPFQEIRDNEDVSISLDYEGRADGYITITLYNNGNTTVDNVVIESESVGLLLNPIILPPNQLITKNLFVIESTMAHISSIKALSGKTIGYIEPGKYGKDKVKELENIKFKEKIIITIKGKDYEVGVNLHEIVKNVLPLEWNN